MRIKYLNTDSEIEYCECGASIWPATMHSCPKLPDSHSELICSTYKKIIYYINHQIPDHKSYKTIKSKLEFLETNDILSKDEIFAIENIIQIRNKFIHNNAPKLTNTDHAKFLFYYNQIW